MRWSIKRQLILLTLIPNVMIVVLLSGYFIHVRIFDHEKYLFSEGQYIAKRLTRAAHQETLSFSERAENMVGAALSYYDVTAAVIYSDQGEPIANSGSVPRFAQIMSMLAEQHRAHPVGLVAMNGQTLYVEPVFSSLSRSVQPAAYLVITLNNSLAQILNSNEIIATLVITLLVLCFSVCFSLKISHEISTPIVEVNYALERIKCGHTNIRIKSPAKGELKHLKIGMNTLIDTFLHRRKKTVNGNH